MHAEALSLYKLMLLFMLEKARQPLSLAQMGDFFLAKDYMGFLELQESAAQLESSDMLLLDHRAGQTFAHISSEGLEAIGYFSGRIHPDIRREIIDYLSKNRQLFQENQSVASEVYPNDKGGFDALLTLKEGEEELVRIQLSLPAKDMAYKVCESWRHKNSDIYAQLVRFLF